MPILTIERKHTGGPVIEADTKYRISFLDGIFVPRCYLEDVAKRSAKLKVWISGGSEEKGHEISLRTSEREAGEYLPKKGDWVPVNLTTVRVFGLRMPFISRNRLVI